MSFFGFLYKLCHASGIGLGRIPTGLLSYSSRDTQGTRTYPGQTPYDCVILADYRTRIGRAPEGDRTISDDDRPMSLRHPITNFPPLSTHCRPIIGTFCYSPPPPPHQKIRKTFEIVPEKMKKSSIEILQILVLSKYN